jgi:hypothetical protein
MHRFRTKLLTKDSKKSKQSKNKKWVIAPSSTKKTTTNLKRSLSLKLGTDKVDDNMIRMEVINKFKQNFKMARISRSIGKKVSMFVKFAI